MSHNNSKIMNEPIAIIGMGCRLPGAKRGYNDFWKMLLNGVDAVKEVTSDRWEIEKYEESVDPDGKNYGKYGGFIDEIDMFDPNFFGMSEIEAASMDPQQRLLLKVIHDAIEDSYLTLDQIKGKPVGVFAGYHADDYSIHSKSAYGEAQINLYELFGNLNSFIAGRISYWLDVNGPSMVISTACSSSLVAIHLACESLRNSECNMAIACGVNTLLSPYWNIIFSKMNVSAKDGKCKSFDKNADGFAPGEGCGVILLKKLSDALTDGDRIHAVVHGTSTNHIGHSKTLTTPSAKALKELINKSLKQSNLNANKMCYIETHGTGTFRGDSIEMEGIYDTYGKAQKDKKLIIGSVKTNISHLMSVSGIAGLIKSVLILKNKMVPPNLHFNKINPELKFDPKKMLIPTKLTTLESCKGKYYASVSSLGLSGTGAHVIIGDICNFNSNITHINKADNAITTNNINETSSKIKNENIDENIDENYYILGISGKTKRSLKLNAKKLLDFLKHNKTLDFSSFCYSSLVTKTAFDYRKAIVTNSCHDAILQITDFINNFKQNQNPYLSEKNIKTAFLFPGLGEQYLGVAKNLYQNEPLFKKHFEKCEKIINSALGISLNKILQFDSKQSVQPAKKLILEP